MKIFMVGGTGLLGSEAARELIKRGHEITSIALPPLPIGAKLPPEMKVEYGNYLEMSDEEIRKHFIGCDGFVFAAGIDERVEGPSPIYELYKKYNIDPIQRLLKIAREVGVKHIVICGSYFSYFAKERPKLKLTKWHPYIRSRIDQEKVSMSFANKDFDVAVLELPYIFGAQPGRKPVWVFLVERILNMKKSTMYPKGGTAMITVRQTAEAIAGAMERNRGGNCYPIGYFNMTWKEMLTIMHKYLGCPDKKIITIPNWLFKLAGIGIMKEQKKNNIESGLHVVKFAALQCSNQYIDKSLGCDFLGVTEDDIDVAIGESIKLSMEIIENKVKVVGMKGE